MTPFEKALADVVREAVLNMPDEAVIDLVRQRLLRGAPPWTETATEPRDVPLETEEAEALETAGEPASARTRSRRPAPVLAPPPAPVPPPPVRRVGNGQVQTTSAEIKAAKAARGS